MYNFLGLFERRHLLGLLQRTRSPAMITGGFSGKSDSDDDDMTPNVATVGGSPKPKHTKANSPTRQHNETNN